jgi:hypothetical protein
MSDVISAAEQDLKERELQLEGTLHGAKPRYSIAYLDRKERPAYRQHIAQQVALSADSYLHVQFKALVSRSLGRLHRIHCLLPAQSFRQYGGGDDGMELYCTTRILLSRRRPRELGVQSKDTEVTRST